MNYYTTPSLLLSGYGSLNVTQPKESPPPLPLLVLVSPLSRRRHVCSPSSSPGGRPFVSFDAAVAGEEHEASVRCRPHRGLRHLPALP